MGRGSYWLRRSPNRGDPPYLHASLSSVSSNTKHAGSAVLKVEILVGSVGGAVDLYVSDPPTLDYAVDSSTTAGWAGAIAAPLNAVGQGFVNAKFRRH